MFRSLILLIALIIVLPVTGEQLEVLDGPLPGMEFVTIPAGEFWMGTDSIDAVHEDEFPRQFIEISSFEIMRTEVTQGLWEELMGTDISALCDLAGSNCEILGCGPEYPVYYVNIYDCHDFLQLLNEMDTEYVYRLPTEAEWEYACRAGTDTEYFWGDQSWHELAGNFCWFRGNANEEYWLEPHADENGTQPVATRYPNPWGLFDMNGNVKEWCSDWYHPTLEGTPADGSRYMGDRPNTIEEVLQLRNVLKGGAWYWHIEYCRSASKDARTGNHQAGDAGFRVVRVPRTGEAEAGYYCEMGLRKIQNLEFMDALTFLEMAIDISPRVSEFHLYHGEACLFMGDYSQAELDYTEAIRLDPANPHLYFTRATLRGTVRDHQGAIPDFDRTIELDPTYFMAHHLRGIALLFLGRYEEALADLSVEIELHSDVPEPWFARGTLYYEMDKPELALSDIEMALEIDSLFTYWSQARSLREKILEEIETD